MVQKVVHRSQTTFEMSSVKMLTRQIWRLHPCLQRRCYATQQTMMWGILEQRYEELCRRFESGDSRAVAQMYTQDCQLLTYGQPPIRGRAGVEKFSAGFMGHKMDTMRIEILDVQCGGENTALDTHRNITTKTTPQGTTILASKDVVVWRRVGEEWLLHIDIYTPDPPATTLEKEIEEIHEIWMRRFAACDVRALSQLYTPDCRILAENVHLQQSRNGCTEVYQSLLNAGITSVDLSAMEVEDLGSGLVSVTGAMRMFRGGAKSSMRQGKFLRILKRGQNGKLQIDWECSNYDSSTEN